MNDDVNVHEQHGAEEPELSTADLAADNVHITDTYACLSDPSHSRQPAAAFLTSFGCRISASG